MFCQLNNVKEKNTNNSGSKQILILGNPFFSKKCYQEDIKRTQSNNSDNDKDSDPFLPLLSYLIQSKSRKVDKEAKNSTKDKEKAGGRNKDGKKSVTERKYYLVPCLLGLPNGSAFDV